MGDERVVATISVHNRTGCRQESKVTADLMAWECDAEWQLVHDGYEPQNPHLRLTPSLAAACPGSLISQRFNALNVNLWSRADSADWADEEMGERLPRRSTTDHQHIHVSHLPPPWRVRISCITML